MKAFWRDLAGAVAAVLADILPVLRAAFTPIAGLAGGVGIMVGGYASLVLLSRAFALLPK
jgi:hypothetical protein